MKNNCDCGWGEEDILNLQLQIDKKLAKSVNRFRSSQKFDLGLTLSDDLYLKLSEYKELLTKLLYCDSCYKDYKIGDIISLIKNKINEL